MDKLFPRLAILEQDELQAKITHKASYCIYKVKQGLLSQLSREATKNI